jgi:hypothetical protein
MRVRTDAAGRQGFAAHLAQLRLEFERHLNSNLG